MIPSSLEQWLIVSIWNVVCGEGVSPCDCVLVVYKVVGVLWVDGDVCERFDWRCWGLKGCQYLVSCMLLSRTQQIRTRADDVCSYELRGLTSSARSVPDTSTGLSKWSVSACLPVLPSVYLFFHLSVCLSVHYQSLSEPVSLFVTG